VSVDSNKAIQGDMVRRRGSRDKKTSESFRPVLPSFVSMYVYGYANPAPVPFMSLPCPASINCDLFCPTETDGQSNYNRVSACDQL